LDWKVPLIAVVMAGLLGFMSSQPKGLPGFSKSDAVDAAMNDVSGFITANYGPANAYKEVIDTSAENGKWTVVIDVTVNPHDFCPEVQRVTYEMFPIRYRNETLVTSGNCHARPITRRAEAIIDSYANSPMVKMLAKKGYKACAFEIPVNDVRAQRQYCDFIDDKGISKLAWSNDLEDGSWVVQWSAPNNPTYFVALYQTGTIVTVSQE
jgi:hypothetical protein